jgi:tetraacyldisaccharide 4'-kinase
LLARGWQPGIISRGYGAQRAAPHRVNHRGDPALVGDEPVMLAQSTDCPVWVGADRVGAGRALLAAHPSCNVIIADDGLQHYRLARDFEIAVVDAARAFGNGHLLPAGPLRERVRRLDTVDAVVVNGNGAPPIRTRTRGFVMQLSGDTVCDLHGARAAALADWRGQRVHAVAGIGNPQRFFNDLRAFGLDVVEHAFADHHVFTPAQLEFGDDAPIVMTQKDAVKCQRFAKPNWFMRPVQAHLDGGMALVDFIVERVRRSDGSKTA